MVNPGATLPRSFELMSADDSALLVVDVQDKLVKLIPDHQTIIWNIRRLLDGAAILGVSRFATEQYPKGLGPTTRELAERLEGLGNIPDKVTFSCGGSAQTVEALRSRNIAKLLVCGIEAHVCVQQTVLDFLASSYRVYVAADAIGSRGERDCVIALRRMEASGAILTTTEAALFEWCQTAQHPGFKQISGLVRETPPTASVTAPT